jgi:prolyl oligopeptidase
LVDVVEWTKFNNLEWKKDGSGFFYARFLQPEANAVLTSQARNHTLYFHRVGSKQEDDEVIYAPREHPEWLLSAWVAPDGKSLYISVAAASSNNALYYRDLERKEAPVIPLIEGFTDANQPIGQIAGKVIVRTTKDAPNGRVVSFDPRKPEPGNWTTLIPERKEPLEDALMAPGKILTSYLVDVKSSLRVYSLDGKLENEVKLPAPGVAIWSDQSEQETERYFTFETITSPASVYRYDTERRTVSLVFQPERTFDASQYETIQVFYPSKDGTKIPMFLSYKKGLQRNGTNPVMLYGYGGFNISLTPRFSPYPLGWMEMGGIYAVANLRGGGEYGEKWHLAGSKQNKQNVFDDFIAAAEWLIGEKYTNSKKLAILGGSNGGLLVGACLNQRPDLFAAAIPAVGVMDMLRFHKFTIGAAWAGDYGNPDLPEDFAVVRKYSPIHNIKKGTVYPATLISTADHDDRVVPAHSFKYAATMQYSQEGKAPILIRIETQAGHGGGKPKSKQIDEWTDMIAFLRDSLAMAPRPQ